MIPSMRLHAIGLLIVLLATSTGTGLGQGTQADYERAKNLRKLTREKVFRTKVQPHWFAENTKFWYRNDLADKRREFVLVDVIAATRGPAMDHARLAKALSEKTGKQHDAKQLPFDTIEFDASGSAIFFRAEEKRWKCELKDYTMAEDTRPEPPEEKPAEEPERRGRRGSRRRRRRAC